MSTKAQVHTHYTRRPVTNYDTDWDYTGAAIAIQSNGDKFKGPRDPMQCPRPAGQLWERVSEHKQ